MEMERTLVLGLRIAAILCLSIIVVVGSTFFLPSDTNPAPASLATSTISSASTSPQGPATAKPPAKLSVPVEPAPTELSYTFNVPDILDEAPNIEGSNSPYWWVNSGGKLIITDGKGETIQGDLPPIDQWRVNYALTNPTDTDMGLHPQNIFRLITKSQWDNVREQAFFYVAKDNFSKSPNRNESNGVLLMSRYSANGQTLYYAGIRVDGTAVIKKKYHGVYYTMAQKQLFPGSYSIKDNIDLLPHNQWFGLRTETTTDKNGNVTVRLYMQSSGDSAWTKLLEATDNGSAQYGHTPPIAGSAYTGIRTDFMDVQFENFYEESM